MYYNLDVLLPFSFIGGIGIMGLNSYVVNQKLMFLSKQSMDFLPSNFPKSSKRYSYDMKAIDTKRIMMFFRVCCFFSLDTRSGECK